MLNFKYYHQECQNQNQAHQVKTKQGQREEDDRHLGTIELLGHFYYDAGHGGGKGNLPQRTQKTKQVFGDCALC